MLALKWFVIVVVVVVVVVVVAAASAAAAAAFTVIQTCNLSSALLNSDLKWIAERLALILQ